MTNSLEALVASVKPDLVMLCDSEELTAERRAALSRIVEHLTPPILLALIAALEQAQLRVSEQNKLIRWAHDTLLEINPSNYSHDDACELNAASVEVILGLAPSLGEMHGHSAKWWSERAEDERAAELEAAAVKPVKLPDDGIDYKALVMRLAEIAHGGRTDVGLLPVTVRSLQQISAIRLPCQLSAATSDVIAERQRQVSAEGWTTEHDDEYTEGEMADAGACYAIFTHQPGMSTPAHWPWPPKWWKQTDPRRDLVKAGALILAEIERIDRAAGIQVEGEL